MEDGKTTDAENTHHRVNAESSNALPSLKYAPFYADVFGSTFYASVFSTFERDAQEFPSPILSQNPTTYQSVPTDETSLFGRERRKKQKHSDQGEQAKYYLTPTLCHTMPSNSTRQSTTPCLPYVDEGDVVSFLQQLFSEDTPEATQQAQPLSIKQSKALQSNETCLTPPGDEFEATQSVYDSIQTRPTNLTDCIAVMAPKIKKKKDKRYTRKESARSQEGRSSRFRGVTKHRRSGRWEAHIWIKELGRQIYLGGYDKEEHAAEAYDVTAIKSKGDKVKTNFDPSNYSSLSSVLDSVSLDELVMIVRRQSQGFSRGTSVFRGVTYHPSGRWEARIGIPGSKHIYLGLYQDELEAAMWYDRALVRLRGPAAATNFLLSNYHDELDEHHDLKQHCLQGDEIQAAVARIGVNFEHWVKYGRRRDMTSPQSISPQLREQQLISQYITRTLANITKADSKQPLRD